MDDELRYEIVIPRGLSLLVHQDPNAEVIGLDRCRPSAAAGQHHPSVVQRDGRHRLRLLGLAAWTGFAWWRRRDLPRTRWFLRAVAVSGVAAVVALEAGWIATEVGRQPWIVYQVYCTVRCGQHRARPAVRILRRAAVYAALTGMTAYVLRRLAGQHQALAPQEDRAVGAG